jgi:phosphate transport system protein
MTIHFQFELQKLKNRLLALGAMVEESVHKTIKAIEERNAELAADIIDADREIDEKEVEVEEECLKILALHQPVAVDLRFIASVIKINNDLERIGDEAGNIAERVIDIASRPPLEVPFDFPRMAAKAELMLKSSLDALVNLDTDLAYKIGLLDDEVDEFYREILEQVKAMIQEKPDRVAYLINFLLMARHIERIADHATNIAEDVIYMIEGVISRHTGKEEPA